MTLSMGRHFAIAAALWTLGATGAHADPAHFLFVGDLNTGTLLRYNADPGIDFGKPFGLGGNTTNANYITGFGVTEGVHGTNNTIITTTHIGNQWRIARFNRATGAYINNVTNRVFGGIGNILLTQDASTIYVPDEAASTLYKIDVKTGATLASVSMQGVHDVATGPNGIVYATAYSTTQGVKTFDANLNNPQTLITYGDNG